MQQVCNAYTQVRKASTDKPIAILAKTFKGRNFLENIENSLSWHGKVIGAHTSKVIEHLKSLIKNPNAKVTPKLPEFECPEPAEPHFSLPDTLDYDRSNFL